MKYPATIEAERMPAGNAWRRSSSGIYVPDAAAVDNQQTIIDLGPYIYLDGARGKFWKDSARTEEASVTDTLGAWDDISGNDRHATQATAADEPLLEGATWCKSGGADDAFDLANLTTLTVGEVFAVCRSNNTGGTGHSHWSIGSYAATDSSHLPLSSKIYDSFGSTVRKVTGNPPQDMSVDFIYNALSKTGEWTCWIENTQVFTTGTNVVGFLAVPELFNSIPLGRNWSHATARMYAFVLFDKELSAADKLTVYNALARIYGITEAS